jgi:hypothetical protein
MIEGSGSGLETIPLTSGSRSGSRKPKTCGSGGSGSATLPISFYYVVVKTTIERSEIYEIKPCVYRNYSVVFTIQSPTAFCLLS